MIAIDPEVPGGPEVLKPVQRPVPEPGEGEVLIKVEAAGVNRPDVMQRLGLYPPPPGAPSIPGLEVAGTVVAGPDELLGLCNHRAPTLWSAPRRMAFRQTPAAMPPLGGLRARSGTVRGNR